MRARAAVRVLHAWHDHGFHQPPLENPDPTEEEIREALEGNYCRCTGYENIVKAVQQAARNGSTQEVGA